MSPNKGNTAIDRFEMAWYGKIFAVLGAIALMAGLWRLLLAYFTE